MKELDELVKAAAEADSQLAASLEEIRAAGTTAAELVTLTARVQAEGHDAEFEEIPAKLRAHLDGRLLQRTRYVGDRAAELSNKLRDLAQGVRDLKADCAAIAELASSAATDLAPADRPA